MIADSTSTSQPCDAASFVAEAGKLLIDRHCEDVMLLDVTGLSQVCDYVLIATGTSDRQMKSVSDEVGDFGEDVGFCVFRKNIDTGTTWIVVDFVTVVVHLFEPQCRAYYDLESLWSDAKKIDILSQTTAP